LTFPENFLLGLHAEENTRMGLSKHPAKTNELRF
jgi:hypothetical protein